MLTVRFHLQSFSHIRWKSLIGKTVRTYLEFKLIALGVHDANMHSYESPLMEKNVHSQFC